MILHKPAVYRTVLCCTCVVLSGPRSSAFVVSSLPPGHTTLRFPVVRGGCHGERIPSKSASLSVMRDSRCDVRIKKDVVVIGGGLAGLSTALELAKRGRQVTVLSRSREEAALESAGGMIAPQSERLESGVYLDLCLASRAMYAEWISGIEAIAGQGKEARTHLLSYGGILSPAFDGDAVHVWNPPAGAGYSQWIEKDQALEMEPSLSPEIVGAWWYPQDMSIDAQRLFRVLEQACTNAGVEILEGTSASGLVHSSGDSSVEAVLLEDGRRFHAEAYISATGAWMRELMPVPMLPQKGQMMSLREVAEREKGSPINPTRVFSADGCYIIPRRDGRIVVGSTVEVGEYGRHNTPAGIKKIIDAAVKVCPSLGEFAIERTWAGLRPVTPDTMPVLGPSSLWRNLYMAGGYWRNGVLLAPKTAQIVADALCGCLPPHDEVFLRAFTMERFTGSSGFSGQRMLAEARRKFAPVGIEVPQQPSSGKYSTGMSQSELLEMERAALEGSNDGSMLEGLDDLVETHADVGGERWLEAKLPHAGLDIAAPSVPREPVNDYDASEDFSEERLKEARLSNRRLHEGGDTRLEAMFGDDDSQEDEDEESNQDMNIKAWEEGAEEVAKALGAEIVEVDIDIPEGMTEEEYMAQQSPILKVFWKSPNGEDIEIPRGMNIAAMVEAGMIPPLEDNDHDEEGNNAVISGTGQRETAPGVFDPTAVKGAQERSTEMNELYTKVMANKAKVSDSRDGTPTSDQKESSMSHNGFTSTGEGRVTGVQSETMTGGAEDAKEMVGYDFILQDRDDKDGDAAKKARASTRDAPEGEDAWAIYEDIANQAVASFGEDSVDSLSP